MATLPTSDNLKRQVNRFKRKRNDAPPAVTPEDLLDLVIPEQYKVNIFSTLYRVIGTPRVVIHLDTINLVYTLIYIVPSQCHPSLLVLELDILIAILVLDIDTYLIDFVCVFQYFKFSIHLSLTLRRRGYCVFLL